MSDRSDPPEDWAQLREKVIGLGARSFRKSYYPELQEKLFHLERFRLLLDDVSDAILVVESESGQVADANRFAAKLLGYEQETLRTMRFGALLEGGDEEARVLLVKREKREKRSADSSLTMLLTEAGEKVAVELTCRVEQYRGVTYATVVARDVSDRLRAENELRLAKERAESANRAKADLLTKLADANKRKDEFLAMLGHELRNPLAPISTAADIIRLRSKAKFERETGIIKRQVHHMAELVDDLLDVSRIVRGAIELDKGRIEVADLVSAALEISRPLIEKRGHIVEVSIPLGLQVEVDPRRGTQIFVNLITNAAKYTQRGGRIQVTGTRHGDEVLVEVSDNGEGIPEELRSRIFDLFSQGKRELDRAEGGLGIGLAIVKNLVELQGGSVAVESKLGKGSTFSVRLPAQTGGTEARRAPRTTRPAQSAHDRVLLVDDNEDLAEVLSSALEEFGFSTMAAKDGPTALACAKELAPTVAVLDIGLPVMDGYEIARRLRAVEGLSDLRLIAISGYGEEADLRRSKEAGFEAHLLKPLDLETLVSAIETPASQPPLPA